MPDLFDQAYAWIEQNEDSTQQHKVVPDSCPSGCAGPCYAVSGINSGAFPAEFAAIVALPQGDRGPAVKQFYHDHFYNQWLSQLDSVDVQDRIFDTAVNSGMGTAVKIAQTAVNSFSATTNQLVVDGGWGPKTIAAINAVDPKTFVAAFCAARVAHLQKYDAASPYLAQLIARAEK